MKLFRSLTTLLLGLTTAASVALAAPTGLGAGSAGTGSPFAGGGQPKTVTVQLVSRQTAGIPRATNDIGILLKHEPGWHTYWQFSGDSGFAPSVEWKLPRRWTAEQIGWPTPQKHKLGPITNFVYSGEVLLPFNLDIPWGTPYGGTYTLRAKVDYLACKEVCIPGTAEVSMKLPVDDRLPAAGFPRARERQAAFLSLVCARFFDDLGVEHHHIASLIIERDDAPTHADHIRRHADAACLVCFERLQQIARGVHILRCRSLGRQRQKRLVLHDFSYHIRSPLQCCLYYSGSERGVQGFPEGVPVHSP